MKIKLKRVVNNQNSCVYSSIVEGWVEMCNELKCDSVAIKTFLAKKETINNNCFCSVCLNMRTKHNVVKINKILTAVWMEWFRGNDYDNSNFPKLEIFGTLRYKQVKYKIKLTNLFPTQLMLSKTGNNIASFHSNITILR